MAQEAGEVDCCFSVNLQNDKKLRALLLGQPWPGIAILDPFIFPAILRAVRTEVGAAGYMPSTPTAASGGGV